MQVAAASDIHHYCGAQLELVSRKPSPFVAHPIRQQRTTATIRPSVNSGYYVAHSRTVKGSVLSNDEEVVRADPESDSRICNCLSGSRRSQIEVGGMKILTRDL